MDKCSYYGCENVICESEKDSENEMRFCQVHLDTVNKLIDAEDAPGIVKFWIDSGGGPKRMAHRMIYGN